MKTTAAPPITKNELGSVDTPRARNAVVAAGLIMSWQLLFVVVLPVVGGHLLDERFDTGSVWAVIGLVVSIVGMIVVVRQSIKTMNEALGINTKERDAK